MSHDPIYRESAAVLEALPVEEYDAWMMTLLDIRCLPDTEDQDKP